MSLAWRHARVVVVAFNSRIVWLTVTCCFYHNDQALNAEIFATIMDFFATGEEVMSDEPIVTVRPVSMSHAKRYSIVRGI